MRLNTLYSIFGQSHMYDLFSWDNIMATFKRKLIIIINSLNTNFNCKKTDVI